jgi:putative transcriptional regulator
VAHPELRNRLKVLRAERDWTQADLAEAVGVSRKTINTIERGVFAPSAVLALRLARVFGAAVEDVFSLTDDETVG